MTAILEVVGPVFGLMALGWVAARRGALSEAGVRGLVLFVFNFAIPALLFRSLATMGLPEDVAWGFLVAFYASSLVTYGLGVAVGRWAFRRPRDEQAICGMAAAFSNTVLMGIPVVLTALGPEATLPLFLIIAFHSATLMPLTVALIHLGRGEGVSGLEQVQLVSGELLKNPIVVGLMLGLGANLGGVALPGAADTLLELLGGAAVPCALFAMGASLAAYPAGADGASVTVLSTLKLVVHPALVWVLAGPVLGLEGVWLATPVLLAAMPSGVNVYLFAARYEAAPRVAARTVLVTSVSAIVTLSLLVAVLR